MPYSLVLPGELTANYGRREPIVISESIFRKIKAVAEVATEVGVLTAVTIGTVIFFTGLNLVMFL